MAIIPITDHDACLRLDGYDNHMPRAGSLARVTRLQDGALTERDELS